MIKITRTLAYILYLLVLACTQFNAMAQPLPTTIADIQQQYKDGLLTAVQLTKAHIANIKQLNPQYNAVIAIDPSALKQAKQYDDLQTQGKWAGPLHGITVLLKDNIETIGPVATTAGSLALKNNIINRDATVVKKLREAGAIILGKTNLSEWANFRSSYSSPGWSSIAGQTNNAIDSSRNPCGSSAGSAVALALNFATVTLGTETDGSIICPASVNGVYAIKPSMGQVSREGIVPLSNSQDTIGPMAHSLEDALATLEVIQGIDKKDATTKDYKLSNKTIEAKNKLRIGALAPDRFTIETQQLFQRQLKTLKRAGHKITPVSIEGDLNTLFIDEYFVLLYEFKADINAYLNNAPTRVKVTSLAELIAFNNKYKRQVMPHFGQDILIQSEAIHLDEDKEKYLKAKSRYKQLALTMLNKAYTNIDVLITPSTSEAWKTDLINDNKLKGSSSSTLSAIAGTTHITLPLGEVNGLPVGLSILAAPNKEQHAYTYAKQINQALKSPLSGLIK
ncbi:MAG: amidase family protein [Pseudoalteromonas sp.]